MPSKVPFGKFTKEQLILYNGKQAKQSNQKGKKPKLKNPKKTAPGKKGPSKTGKKLATPKALAAKTSTPIRKPAPKLKSTPGASGQSTKKPKAAHPAVRPIYEEHTRTSATMKSHVQAIELSVPPSKQN